MTRAKSCTLANGRAASCMTMRSALGEIPANAFATMADWLVQTCRYFATRPDLQLLAETSGKNAMVR